MVFSKNSSILLYVERDSKLDSGYKWGFETDIKSVKIPKGLNEKTIRTIRAV